VNEPRTRDSELSRIYSEGAWPEPRRQIDDAILAASRRAARARHPVLHRWGPPFALAATVIVGVSLAVMVSEQESLRDARGFFRDSEPAAEPPAPQKKREAAPVAPKLDAAPKNGAAPRAAQPPSTELFASPMGPDHRAPAPKPAPAPKAGTVPPAAPAKRPQQSAPAPDPQRADRIRRELDQLEEKRARDAGPASPPPAEEKPQAAPSSASVSDVRGLVASPVARTPEAWLEDIRRLKEQGRTADAERELGEFRKRYPGYRVPDDLR
jgi:hypothetical protein